MAKEKPENNKTAKTEPLEKQLWKAADKLRKNIDAAEYKQRPLHEPVKHPRFGQFPFLKFKFTRS